MMINSIKNMMVFTLWALVIMWLSLRLFDEVRFRFDRSQKRVMQIKQLDVDGEQDWQLSRREFRQAMDDLYEFFDKRLAERELEYKVQEDKD